MSKINKEAAIAGDLAAALSTKKEQEFVPTHIYHHQEDGCKRSWSIELDGKPVRLIALEKDGEASIDTGGKDTKSFKFVKRSCLKPISETLLETLRAYIPKPTHLYKRSSEIQPIPVIIVDVNNGEVRITARFGCHDMFNAWVGPETLTPIKAPTPGCSNEVKTELPAPANPAIKQDAQDLVHFTVPKDWVARTAFAKVLREVFGICYGDYDKNMPLSITCRLDQYGKFAVMLGAQNNDPLKVRIIVSRDRANIFDVSGR